MTRPCQILVYLTASSRQYQSLTAEGSNFWLPLWTTKRALITLDQINIL